MDNTTINEAVLNYLKKHNAPKFTPKAALIDMDGTLLDSMSHHAAAWKRLSEEQRLNADINEFYIYEGMSGRAILQMMFRRDKGIDLSDADADELYSVKSRYFNEMPRVKPIDGAAEMLALLARYGIKRVLVTGSRQKSNLDRLDTDFPGAFTPELRVTAADTARCKPAPDPYLKGMELAGASPQECIVIENAPLGVESGAASGAFTVAVTTGPIPAEAFKQAGAHLVFDSMEQLVRYLPLLLNN